MTSLALALLLLVRLIVPLIILLTLGEWVRRREINYWFQR
jgi:hypothetical protein